MLYRLMYGFLAMMFEVVALTMNTGVLEGVETVPTATAFGVKIKPVSISTCSCTISSCARRFALSGAMPPSSRRMISILRPLIVSPCCRWKSWTISSNSLPAVPPAPENE